MSKPIALLLCLTGLLLSGGCGSGRSAGEASGVSPAITSSPTVSPSLSVHSAAPSPAATPKPAPSAPTAGSTGSSAQDVLSRMTLEEKIGQMILAGIDGTELDENAKSMIASRRVGGIILYANNLKSLESAVTLVNALKTANAGSPAPLFISVDQEGGKVSRLPKEYAAIPANAAVGKSGSPELAGTMGRLLARELRSAGFNMDFAPVLDINSNPGNPVIGERSFGNTADKVTKLGIAELKGLRGERIIPVVKHFPGHGDTSVDSHLELPVVNKTSAQLRALEWQPFEAAVKENAEAVMVAHILFPKLDSDKPASLSEAIIGRELRGRMGYKGVVITDDLGMGAIKKHYDLAAAAVSTVKAGSDILLVGHGYGDARLVFDTLLGSVRSGALTEKRIDESITRILSLKTGYQLSDKTVPVPDLTALNRDIGSWIKQLNP
ncbi:beta-N-acetylhexosaminidase [Gorillibacterium sp. sgz5001074]|uniref:beta-N-acetylhexosaminidase n=1 Tax=Gorillibacterium sp. sgz5001074 TaxID=3446695 RepID=UPI003F6689CA